MNNERQEIEAQIIERAWEDPAFRAHLLADPRSALALVLGAELPPGISLTVLEETPTARYLVLPPRPEALAGLQVGDAELALAGGGRTSRPSICCVGGTGDKCWGQYQIMNIAERADAGILGQGPDLQPSSTRRYRSRGC